MGGDVMQVYGYQVQQHICDSRLVMMTMPILSGGELRQSQWSVLGYIRLEFAFDSNCVTSITVSIKAVINVDG